MATLTPAQLGLAEAQKEAEVYRNSGVDAVLVARAEAFAATAHAAANQTYGGKPYSVHLTAVVMIATAHRGDLFDSCAAGDIDAMAALFALVMAACYTHDTREDIASVTPAILTQATSADVARVVEAVTDRCPTPTATWEERKAATYPFTAAEPLAIFVKLCDRIANMRQGIHDGLAGGSTKKLRRYVVDAPLLKAALGAPGAAWTSLWATFDVVTEEASALLDLYSAQSRACEMGKPVFAAAAATAAADPALAHVRFLLIDEKTGIRTKLLLQATHTPTVVIVRAAAPGSGRALGWKFDETLSSNEASLLCAVRAGLGLPPLPLQVEVAAPPAPAAAPPAAPQRPAVVFADPFTQALATRLAADGYTIVALPST